MSATGTGEEAAMDDATAGRGGYFRSDTPAAASGEGGRYVRVAEVPGLHPVSEDTGLTLRPVFGANMTISFVSFEPHTEAPTHRHAEEQMGTVLEGSLEFDLDGDRRVLGPGDVYVVPPWVPHGAMSGDAPALALDAFSPPREGFAELMEQALRAAAGDASAGHAPGG
jgi:quercetin dioxygenase-like cupin family protein